MNDGPWSFALQYPRPPKGLHANDRVHWRRKARSTEEVRQEVTMRVRALRLGELGKISVQVTWIVGDARKRDDDNIHPLCKVIYDAIGSNRGTSARLVADDDPAHMVKLAPAIRTVRGETPHFLVTITCLEEVPL